MVRRQELERMANEIRLYTTILRQYADMDSWTCNEDGTFVGGLGPNAARTALGMPVVSAKDESQRVWAWKNKLNKETSSDQPPAKKAKKAK